MHPDDFPFVLDTINQAVRFLQDQPPAEKLNYKLIVDYRLKNCKGEYMRFLQQLVVLEPDRSGNIWLILKLFDLVSTVAGNEPSQRSLVNIKTGKKCLFDDPDASSSSRILTKREVEILGLISQGLDSRNISDRLFISVYTVNNHRQNILSKTRSGNISQAMIYARRIGILG
jgi:DNA-binding CsgD family transcriptional regulator